MSNRKKFSEEEIKNVGFRIKACRALTGLTQEEFGNNYGIPAPSLKTWEFGGVVPRMEGLKKFTDCLRERGIFVSVDWILFATGTGPSYLLEQNSGDISSDSEFLLDDINVFNELFKKFCKKHKKNPIIFEVKDDEMSPIYRHGDVIAGHLLDNDSFNNDPSKAVLVKLEDNNYAPRFLHKVDEEFFVCSVKTPVIKRINLNSFGCVIWHKSN